MKIDLNILNDYIGRGLVVKQDHPTLPLSIYNYSRACQYDNAWDDVTIMCRGLVLDNEGNVIAKSFPKFFNLEQHKPEEIPNEPFEVFDKMDGSLGVAFYYKGDWIMATKGSFTSDQSVEGIKMLKNLSILKNYPTTGLRENWTYLFEIIYENNVIVIKYPFEGLVLLGAYNRDTLEEIDYDTLTKSVSLYPDVKVVRKYTEYRNISDIKSNILQDMEGFVVRFQNGFRMKIKGDEYLRLHRILTNFSTTMIWEILSTNGDIHQYLENVPDEFDGWVRGVVANLQKQFDEIKTNMEAEFAQLVDKKEFALKIVDNPIKSLLFKRLNSYSPDLDDIIWKMIKPKWSKPFMENLDI